MRLWLAALALMAACATPACAQTPDKGPAEASAKSAQAAGWTLYPPLSPGAAAIRCTPMATQGGAILCRALPHAPLALDGKDIARADDSGLAVIGLTRSQKSPAVISYPKHADKLNARPMAEAYPSKVSVVVAKRHDDVGSLEMECAKIAPQNDADKEKAAVSWTKKENALKSFNDPLAPLAISKPVEATDKQYSISSFGRTRTYVPKTKDCKGTTNVHNGTDIAVPTGTEIHAPMAGTVILADPDLFFEGGCIFLDLGRGLVSVTMHMSRIDVKPGQVVKQGELLGLSGSTGRVTGPHVHWAIKYRNVFSDDRGTDIWLDPMLVLKLDAAALTNN